MNFEEIIERKLGRRLDPERRGSIDHLNRVPLALIEDARRLDSFLLAETFLRWFVDGSCSRFLKGYVQQVVFEGTPPQTWLRGRVLIPDTSAQQQLCMDTERLLRPIGGPSNVRVVARIEAWRAGSACGGAPARLEPDADYLAPRVEDTVWLDLSTPTETVTDARVAVRRWIAARLARMHFRAGGLSGSTELESLALPGAPVQAWSADARRAGLGLLRELRELPPSENEVPGFRGPDSWYRD